MKFTFKTEHPTGRYRSFQPDDNIIKLKKKEVGLISDGNGYRISLQVKKKDINEDSNPNCPWKWIKLIKQSQSLQEAKDWLNSNIEKILEKYEIWMEE